MTLPNLDDYLLSDPSTSCYLDGRYFNLVFQNYPGLVKNPLTVQVNVGPNGVGSNNDDVKVGIYMEPTQVNPNDINLIRVIIVTNVTRMHNTNNPANRNLLTEQLERHSNLLIVNNEKRRIYWFQPGDYVYQQKIQKMLLKYLMKYYPDYLLVPVDPMILNEKTPGCKRSGFCVAYVIKYAYDLLNGVEPNYKNIRRFAGKIEKMYGKLDPNGADVEYGLFGSDGSGDNKLGGALLGGLGGAALGTVVTGGSPTGALTGGLLGGTAGYLLS